MRKQVKKRVVEVEKKKSKLYLYVLIAVLALLLIAFIVISLLPKEILPSPARGVAYMIDGAAPNNEFFCNSNHIAVGSVNSPSAGNRIDKLWCASDDVTANQSNRRVISSDSGNADLLCNADEVVCGAINDANFGTAIRSLYCCKTNMFVYLSSKRLLDGSGTYGNASCDSNEVMCGGNYNGENPPRLDQTYCCEYYNSSLIAKYNFDENSGSTASDASGNNRNGQIIGGAAWTNGMNNSALYFNGSNYVNLSLITSAPANLSIMMWVNIPTLSNHGAFIKIGESAGGCGPGDGYGFGVGWSDLENLGNYIVGIYECARWISSAKPIGAGWHHVAFVVDDRGYPNFYIDGIKEYSDSSGSPYRPAKVSSIGGYSEGGQRFFTGKIDEVRIYGRTLTSTEVLNDYKNLACGDGHCDASIGENPSSCSKDCKTVWYYSFDETSGNITYDTSGNGYNGTNYGAVRVSGVKGNAFGFDGVNDYVVQSNATLNLFDIVSNFTMGFWAYPITTITLNAEATSGQQGIAGGGQRYALGAAVGDSFWPNANAAGAGVSVGTNGVSVYEHTTNYLPPLLTWSAPMDNLLNKWTHVVVVYKNNKPSLYINGVKVRDGMQSTKNVHLGVLKDSTIGASTIAQIGNYGNYWGYLDEIKYYSYSLSDSEVLAEYNSVTDITPPYVAFISPIKQHEYTSSSVLVNITNNSDATSISWYNGTAGTTNKTYTGPVSLTLPDGNYNFIAYAQDYAGNKNSTSVSFRVNTSATDTTPPSVSFTSPVNDTYNTNSVSVIIAASADAASVWWYNGTAGTTNKTYSSSVNLNLADGQYTFRAYANDSAGNKNSTAVTFKIDTSIPCLDTDSGLNYHVKGNVTVAGDPTIYADSCYNSTTLTEYFCNGNIKESVLYGCGDGCSNGVCSESDLIVPTISWISPANSNSYNSTFIIVNISAADNNLNSIWWNNETANKTYTQTTNITLSEGAHTLKAWANDTSGNVNSSSSTFVIDLTAPWVNLTNIKNDDEFTVNDDIPFRFNVTDTNAIDECRIISNGNTKATASSITKGVINEINASYSRAREYEVKLACYDAAGNEGNSALINITTDCGSGLDKCSDDACREDCGSGDDSGDDGCTINCTGKTCGAANGCGGKCIVQTCAAGSYCNSTGSCALNSSCVANCTGKVCGSNGCGGSCGTCASGTCNSTGQCVACKANCTGKTCGSNGCGGSCGTCASGSCENGNCTEEETSSAFWWIVIGITVPIVILVIVIVVIILRDRKKESGPAKTTKPSNPLFYRPAPGFKPLPPSDSDFGKD